MQRILVPKDIPVYGYIYDVRTGQLMEVPAAMKPEQWQDNFFNFHEFK